MVIEVVLVLARQNCIYIQTFWLFFVFSHFNQNHLTYITVLKFWVRNFILIIKDALH